MGNTVRTWISEDVVEPDAHTFLIKVSFDGTVRGWQSAYLGGVLDALSDQAYADAIGEDRDEIEVWVLTSFGPVPVKIKSIRHEAAGFVERQVSWRKPGVRGAAGTYTVIGYTKIIDV